MKVAEKEIQIEKYSQYKDSDTDWLKEIPSHWGLLKMKYLFRDVSIKNKPNEELLSVTQDKGVVPRTWVENRMVMPSGALESFKFIEEGDFAISLRSFEGGLEYCYQDGIISPAYTVLKSLKNINNGYFKYLFKSKSFISELQISVVGIRQGKNISYPELSYSLMPIPSIEEQTAIAKFLDKKTAKIDSTLESRNKIVDRIFELINIKVLTENKESNFNKEAKTWEEIFPSNWRLEKAKRIFEEVNLKNNVNQELLAVTQDEGVIFKADSNKNYVSPSGDTSRLKLVKKNDYVISLRSFQGGIETSSLEGIVSPAYNIFKLKPDLKRSTYQKYYQYLFKTPQFIKVLNTLVEGIRDGKNIGFGDFGELYLPIPPEDKLKSMLPLFSTYERSKSHFSKVEKCLLEFKETLISNAVTGKIKVS